MKRTIFIGLFIFSLFLNIAVAATLGWHIWSQKSHINAIASQTAPVNRADWREIRKSMSAQDRSALMETRQRLIAKNSELLDMLAKDPGNTGAAESKVKELVSIREQMERLAIARISTVMSSLPEDRRQSFAEFLKNRACMMPGMGFRRGSAERGRGGMQCLPAPGTQQN
jgi:hypothetical protein